MWVVSTLEHANLRANGFPSPCGVWVVSLLNGRVELAAEFPSPCGVWVVSKIGKKRFACGLFPSPCGVWVVSPLTRGTVQCHRFPSPCGVWVVSYGDHLWHGGDEGFRPLAGCGLFRQSCTFFLVQQEKELSTLLFYCIILADVYQ